MSFSFNGNEKIIQISNGITSIDINDLYIGWKEWVALDNNAAYEQAFRFVGGDPLPGSKKLGTTYFIMNDWKIRPYSGNHTLFVDGNLYSEDGSVPYVSALGSYSVTIINSVSSLVDATVQQLPQIEYASYDGGVSIDPINGTDSILYPYGTPAHPCKTIFNAKNISVERGFKTIYVYGDLTLDSLPDDFAVGYTVIGKKGYRLAKLNITNTILDGCTFENMYLSGACKSGTNIVTYNCDIENLNNLNLISERSSIKNGSYVNTDFHDCVLEGDMQILSGGTFDGSEIVFKGKTTNITHSNNTNIHINVNAGYIMIKNSTSGCSTEFNFKGGELELHSSNFGGDFYAEGTGYLYGDPETLGMNIIANHLISLDTITNSNWNYDITNISATNTIAWYIKNKVLSVAKFIGLS